MKNHPAAFFPLSLAIVAAGDAADWPDQHREFHVDPPLRGYRVRTGHLLAAPQAPATRFVAGKRPEEQSIAEVDRLKGASMRACRRNLLGTHFHSPGRETITTSITPSSFRRPISISAWWCVDPVASHMRAMMVSKPEPRVR